MTTIVIALAAFLAGMIYYLAAQRPAPQRIPVRTHLRRSRRR